MKKRITLNDILRGRLAGFETRPEQDDMAEAVRGALDNSRHLLVEAGTGVGKSFAYLIPLVGFAIENDVRVVVSTFTKALQRQLFEKDVPFIKENIHPELEFALALGGENYLCLRRLEQCKTFGLFDFQDNSYLRDLYAWSDTTETGVRAEVDVPFALWMKVLREGDLCHGKSCRFFGPCFYQKAKAIERKSNLLIVNHHLYFAHVASDYKLLPWFEHAVFDEGHLLEDIAAEYLGLDVSNFRFKHLMDSIMSQQGKGLLSRIKWLPPSDYTYLSTFVSTARTAGEKFFERLGVRLQDNASFRIRSAGFMQDTLSEPLKTLSDEIASIARTSVDEDEKKDLVAIVGRCKLITASLKTILDQDIDGLVYWASREGRRLRLTATPLDVAEIMKTQVLERMASTVLTSATLSTDGNFNFIKNRIGMEDAEELLLKSPFDYMSQAALYVASDLPAPGTAESDDMIIERINEILEITRGRTLVLFTSYRMLEKAAGRTHVHGLRILKQGEKDSYRLCEDFKKDDSSVIFGTYTFWQGIDIPGDALKCVIIAKLPFSVPDEPVTEARIERIRLRGGEPFSDYQVPQAIILLKQGFGRLIRTKKDTGVVAILDSRVVKRSYGQRFIKSLPKCKMITKVDEIEDYL